VFIVHIINAKVEIMQKTKGLYVPFMVHHSRISSGQHRSAYYCYNVLRNTEAMIDAGDASVFLGDGPAMASLRTRDI